MKIFMYNDRLNAANYGIFVQFCPIIVYQNEFDASSVESGIY